jgi:hypothetical protein
MLYNKKYFMNIAILKNPSAFVPIGMSLAALALVVGHAARYGVVHEADEGAAAHLFQLLMTGQVPVMVYFAVRWLPRVRADAIRVLGLQFLAAIAAFAAVYFLT